jgi:hypothetical protein
MKVEYLLKQLGFFMVSPPTALDTLPERVLSDIHIVFLHTWHQLTSLISQVRKCQQLADYYLLQEELGLCILQADSEVDAANKASYQTKKEINKIGNSADPEKKQYLLGKLLEADLKRRQYLLIGKQYRTVGDAMAWQLYHYNAHTISSLGMNQSPGIISQAKEKGSFVEETEIRNYWEHESAFALRHDYTNCLRVSDLSIFRDHSDQAELKEVKASRKKKKTSQKAIQRRALEFAQDHITVLGNGILYYPPVLSTGDREEIFSTMLLLTEAVHQAIEEDIGYRVGKHIELVAYNGPSCAQQPDLQKRLMQINDTYPPLTTQPHSDDYIVARGIDRVRNPVFSAPYAIYPLPPEVAAALTVGLIDIQVRLNVEVILNAFRMHGFDAICSTSMWRQNGLQPGNPETLHPYFVLSKDDKRIRVGDYPIEQMLFEGLTPTLLATTVARTYEECLTRDAFSIAVSQGLSLHVCTTYTQLTDIWRESRSFL